MAVAWTGTPASGDVADYGVREAQISIAVFKREGESTADVKFKYSADGATWPADEEAITVGTLPKAKSLSLVVLGTNAIEIFDATGVKFRSLKGGIEGSWEEL